MIAELQAIISLLTTDPLTVDQVVENLGTVTTNYTPNVVVKPYSSELKEASVLRRMDARTFQHINTPNSVTLKPTMPPTVETLAQAFGEYNEVISTDALPPRIIFYLDKYSKKYTIALIAYIEEGRAIQITLRRDQNF